MNKKAVQIFRKLAAGMPAITNEVKMRVTGAMILSGNPDAKNEKGEAINPDSWYMVETAQYRNHQRAMKRIYVSQGLPAVKKYIDEVLALHKQATHAQIEMDYSLMDRLESAKPYGI